MPTFSVTQTIDADIEVDFDVYCARCGAGLCNQSDTRLSHNRKFPQVTVEPCEHCLEVYAEEKTEPLEQMIEDLKAEICEIQEGL